MSIVPHRTIPYIGATPDGFVIDKDVRLYKLLEIKCPSKRIINPFGKSVFDICPYIYLAQCWT